MAFNCVMHLRDECDGCGRCQAPSWFADDSKIYYWDISYLYEDDEYDPFAIDPYDEM